MFKVFFDSSVLVAAAGSQTGGSFKIITSLSQGKLEGWLNEGVVAESEEAISRKLAKKSYELFMNWLENDYFRILPFPEENKLQNLKEINIKDRHILISAKMLRRTFY